jgi:hypothetical protein
MRLYGEMHRFIPDIAAWLGARWTEVPVSHRPRRFGKSKYGIGRTFRVLLDLITIRYLQGYMTRPIRIFGKWGVMLGGAGFVLACGSPSKRYSRAKPWAIARRWCTPCC